jgi:hypothetical protein
MADLPCNLRQEISAYMGQTDVEFRTDVLLPQPYLLGPRDQAVICLKSTPFGPSNIALSWAAISGATLYVLQWSTNPQMQGASVRQLITASTAVALTRDTQVRIGDTVHWRVFALNLSGGVSPPSETRQFTFNCPEGTDTTTDSDLFNVEAEIVGPNTIRSCEDTSYYVKLSFTEKDANERTICTFDGCAWESELLEGGGTITTPVILANPLFTIANVDTPTQANALIKATLTFTNEITSEEFTKEVSFEAIAEPFAYGCGLKCVEECADGDPYVSTKKVGLDFNAIAGSGLIVNDPRTLDPEDPNYDPCACPVLDVNFGCGLIEKPHCVEGEEETVDKWAVDVAQIAGKHLTVQCKEDECDCDEMTLDRRDPNYSVAVEEELDLTKVMGMSISRGIMYHGSQVTFAASPLNLEGHEATAGQRVINITSDSNNGLGAVSLFMKAPSYLTTTSTKSIAFDLTYYLRDTDSSGAIIPTEYLGESPGFWFRLMVTPFNGPILSGGTPSGPSQYLSVSYNSGGITTTQQQLEVILPDPIPCGNVYLLLDVYMSNEAGFVSPEIIYRWEIKYDNLVDPSETSGLSSEYDKVWLVAEHKYATASNATSLASKTASDEYLPDPRSLVFTARHLAKWPITESGSNDYYQPKDEVRDKLVYLPGGLHQSNFTGTGELNTDRLEVKSVFPMGCGLKAEPWTTSDISRTGAKRISVDYDAIFDANSGILVTAPPPPNDSYEIIGCPTIKIGLGCGLEFVDEYPPPVSGPTRKVIAVDLDLIAGTGLTVVPGAGPGDCPTLATVPGEFASGCGIDIVDGIISVDYSELGFEEANYTWVDTSCPVHELFVGCSTASGLAGTQGVVEAQGLVYYDTPLEGCPQLFTKVNIPYNCTLEIDNGNIGVDLTIFGKGLTVDAPEDECPQVQLCVDDLASPIELSTFSADGTDLDKTGEDVAIAWGQVYFETPDPPNPDSCGQLVTKTAIPLGCSLTATGGLLNLDIASFDTVTPATTMFVLGYDPNKEGCKFVKFAITECPE